MGSSSFSERQGSSPGNHQKSNVRVISGCPVVKVVLKLAPPSGRPLVKLGSAPPPPPLHCYPNYTLTRPTDLLGLPDSFSRDVGRNEWVPGRLVFKGCRWKWKGPTQTSVQEMQLEWKEKGFDVLSSNPESVTHLQLLSVREIDYNSQWYRDVNQNINSDA